LGVIVNDMASVNIDAKNIVGGGQRAATNRGARDRERPSSPSSAASAAPAGGGGSPMIVELQNGCACCSLADELHESVKQLVLDRRSKGREPLDAIVVELSGVADPVAVRNGWKMAPPDVTKLADVRNVVTLVDATSFGTDYLTWDSAGDRKEWGVEVLDGEGGAAQRKVSELLAEQVEAADLILLNKVDLATPEQVEVARAVAVGLNAKARVETVEFGRIEPSRLLGWEQKAAAAADNDAKDSQNSHSHDHGHNGADCADPACEDPSHSHSHDHHDHACADPDCADASHSHDHDHGSSCADPDCADASHSHSHSHAGAATAVDQLGITSFVYRATRPFDSKKLMRLLASWPIPSKTVLDRSLVTGAASESYQVGDAASSPFTGLLRSKGFCWLAPSRWGGRAEDAWRHDTAMYWSHAGKHFSISAAGKWWGTIDRESMKEFFANNLDEYDKIVRDDFVTDEFGDRRQELVFIGSGLDEGRIASALDGCLLTEPQMNIYRQKLQNYMQEVLSVPAAQSSGLFGVGSVDHVEFEQ
jgi:G3E family GTPase